MEHKFNAIAWLEKIEFHPRHRRRPRDMIGRPSLLSGQPAADISTSLLVDGLG
jgi:hypothetical protein